MLKWMAAGAGVLVALGLLAAYVVLRFGWFPANADVQPSALERWAARMSLNATVAREADTSPNPLIVNDANLTAGIKTYATNCMVCHGASDGKRSDIATGLYQHAPGFGFRGVEDNPEGETYWKVQHGIRFTGMPAFGAALTDRQIWQVVMFLKHMDKLPAGPDALWKKQPSQAHVVTRTRL